MIAKIKNTKIGICISIGASLICIFLVMLVLINHLNQIKAKELKTYNAYKIIIKYGE